MAKMETFSVSPVMVVNMERQVTEALDAVIGLTRNLHKH